MTADRRPSSHRLRRALAMAARITVVAVALGALFGYWLSSLSVRGLANGAVIALLTAVPLSLFELAFMAGRWGYALRRAPFALLLVLRAFVYVAVSFVAYVAGRGLVDGFDLAFAVERSALWSLVYSLVFGVGANFLTLVRRLAGPGVIAHFVLGRYHRPRPERRAMLFLDVVGSTAIAERIGPTRFHGLLNMVMYDIAASVVDCGGEIHKYVGDEAIVTWPAAGSGIDPRPADCALLIQERLERRAKAYSDAYGAPVRLRAGLHVGDVVTGELGDQRQEIAMLGDGINTAARLVDAARETGAGVVATVGAVDPQRLRPGWRIRPLGKVALRGKQAAVELLAIERVGGTRVDLDGVRR